MSSATDTVRELMVARTPETDFVPAILADELIAYLRENDPGLLEAYIGERLHSLVTSEWKEVIGNQRRETLRWAGPRAFADTARQAEAAMAEGDHERARVLLSVFDARCTVNAQNTKRRVGDMTGSDHLYVAGSYEQTKVRAAMMSHFHRAVARKVGERRTSEVYTEEQYTAMYDSIVGHPPAQMPLPVSDIRTHGRPSLPGFPAPPAP